VSFVPYLVLGSADVPFKLLTLAASIQMSKAPNMCVINLPFASWIVSIGQRMFFNIQLLILII